MRSHRFTLVDLVVSFALLALGLVLLTPSAVSARAASRQLACTNNFKMMGLALHNYHDVWNMFPPGRVWEPDPGRPTHDDGLSLRVLPFLDAPAVYNLFNFDMSWMTPENKTTRLQKLEAFLCPDDSPVHVTGDLEPAGQPTNMMFSLGSLAWLTHPTHASARLGPAPEGLFFDNSSVGIRDITDGTSFTAFASEQLIDAVAREGSAEMTGECSGITGEGKQYYERTGTRWAAGHPSSNYFNARRTPNDVDPDCFHGTPVGIGSLNKVPRSRHAGGVNLLMADGSVRFLRNNVDLKVWQGLNTRAGGEALDASSF